MDIDIHGGKRVKIAVENFQINFRMVRHDAC